MIVSSVPLQVIFCSGWLPHSYAQAQTLHLQVIGWSNNCYGSRGQAATTLFVPISWSQGCAWKPFFFYFFLYRILCWKFQWTTYYVFKSWIFKCFSHAWPLTWAENISGSGSFGKTTIGSRDISHLPPKCILRPFYIPTHFLCIFKTKHLPF